MASRAERGEDYGPEREAAMSAFMPTTKTVRDAYVYADADPDPDYNPDLSAAAFDRWLRHHDAAVLQAAAEAAEADADSEDHNDTTMRVYRAWSLWLTQRAARIRRGPASAAGIGVCDDRAGDFDRGDAA